MSPTRTLVALLFSGMAALPLVAQDWPMWGGTPQRNMTSAITNLPESWDVRTGKNIKWKAQVGSTSYGNPVVAGGKIFLGTNNDHPRNPDITGDKGVLMCLRESDGAFLWQAVSDKLESGFENDWPEQGICSSPAVEGDRLYYVTSRGELVCLDTEGFADGENDGPIRNEARQGPTDADIVWSLDMIRQLGVFPHNMSSSSPLVWEDLVFAGTSNGRDAEGDKLPAPGAPSFIAVNKTTGKVVWQDNSPGDGILHGQWPSPALAAVDGVQQVIFPGGDGWLYGFDARTGAPTWKFDLNPKNAVWPKTRNYGLATPVVSGGRVFMSVGQDPDGGNGVGHAYGINPAGRGDITESGRVWRYDAINRSMSTAAVAGGLVFMADFRGVLHCLDAATGKPLWTFDMMAAVWGSPLVADGKVYLGDEDGDVAVLAAGAAMRRIAEIDMGSAVYSTPVPANGVLYVMTRDTLYAIAAAAPPPTGQSAYEKNLEIRTSTIPHAGNGVFTKAAIPKGAYLGAYTGEFITEEEYQRRAAANRWQYMMGLLDCATPHTNGLRTIDGVNGNVFTRMNYAPVDFQNVKFEKICDPPFVKITALRDIAAGEELWVDYGPNYLYDFMKDPAVIRFFADLRAARAKKIPSARRGSTCPAAPPPGTSGSSGPG